MIYLTIYYFSIFFLFFLKNSDLKALTRPDSVPEAKKVKISFFRYNIVYMWSMFLFLNELFIIYK